MEWLSPSNKQARGLICGGLPKGEELVAGQVAGQRSFACLSFVAASLREETDSLLLASHSQLLVLSKDV